MSLALLGLGGILLARRWASINHYSRKTNYRRRRRSEVLPQRLDAGMQPRHDDHHRDIIEPHVFEPPLTYMRFATERLHRQPPPILAQAPQPQTIRRDAVPITRDRYQAVSDSQNTHDSAVVRSVAASLKQISSSTGDRSVQDSIKEIHQEIQQRFEGKERSEMIVLLERMGKNQVFLDAFDAREGEVLHRVWLASRKDDNRRDMFFTKLREIQKENPCTVGRVARLVDSLNGLDERIQIKPAWVLRQEWLHRASKEYATYTDEKVPFSSHMKSLLRKEYVDQGLATDKMLSEEIDSWGDMF